MEDNPAPDQRRSSSNIVILQNIKLKPRKDGVYPTTSRGLLIQKQSVSGMEGQACNVQASNVQAMKVQASNIQAMKVQASNIQASNIQAMKVQASNIQASNVQASNVQTSNVRARNVQASNIQASNVQASNVQTSNVRARNVQASNVQASNVQASNVQTSNVRARNVQASNVQASNVQTSNAQAIKAQASMVQASIASPSKGEEKATHSYTASTTPSEAFMTVNSSNDLNEKCSPKAIAPESSRKSKKVKLFTRNKGPEWHKVVNNIVTKPILAKNLPKAFGDLPIFGKPKNNADLKNFQDKACQEFVGLPDDEYDKVKDYCSIDYLLSGNELKMASVRPTQVHISAALALREEEHGIVAIPDNPKLLTLQKLKTRNQVDLGHIIPRKLKYRGVRLLSLHNQEKVPELEDLPPDLDPGQDLLFRVRIYRPFSVTQAGARQRDEVSYVRGRHSVFNCDVLVLGRQRLSALRDRFVCRNDLDLRLDMSQHPDLIPPSTSKDSFPSNFMFINNVFYVDSRANCKDITAVVRRFAEERGMGSFPVRDMCQVTVGELKVRLAYPEVYVHQGNCEHIFQFSEIRLLNNADPLRISNYPCHTAISQNQTLYCNTCAEFSARWIVTKSKRVPFDPAFFCDTCFHSYMYKDGKKVEDFKAYLYKGNEINMLRPTMDAENASGVSPRVHIHF